MQQWRWSENVPAFSNGIHSEKFLSLDGMVGGGRGWGNEWTKTDGTGVTQKSLCRAGCCIHIYNQRKQLERLAFSMNPNNSSSTPLKRRFITLQLNLRFQIQDGPIWSTDLSYGPRHRTSPRHDPHHNWQPAKIHIFVKITKTLF